jgi:putative tricarboxylic transport membrane protein
MIGEMIIKGVILIGSLVLYAASSQFGQLAPYEGVGPEFWPQLLLLGIIGLTGVGLARDAVAYLRRERSTLRVDGAAAAGRSILLVAMAVAFGYAFGMQWMGFLAGTVIFQVVFMYVLRVRSIASLAIVTLVNTGLLYGIFIKLLSMPLPRGVGIFRDLSLFFY